ncbi:MAG: hypothetical protein EPN62_13100 [Candidimonas sp.]|nr:MAG: hypothetical protein EPN77_11275 [Candidimonas sp.]TAM21901.1 MAG: hypothetical protein EPN62_13100 [Candidimonas sp.]
MDYYKPEMKIMKSVQINLLFFGFVINFVWEMLQMPFFSYPADTSLTRINLACIQASAGDAAMIVIAFWVVVFLQKDRKWYLHPSVRSLAFFLLPGVIMTIVFEAMATGAIHRWAYANSMPTLPVLGTGLVPIAQWLLLPLVIIFIVRRQVRQTD